MIEKINILIIDDEPDLREIIIQQIKSNIPLAKCFEANNGREGLQKISRQKFDLVITDLGLPLMPGQTLIQEAQSMSLQFQPRRFIAISGNYNPGSIPTKLGKVEFFSKPINWNLFHVSIKDLIESINNPDSQTVQRKVTGGVDVEFINPFIESTLEVLKTTAGVVAKKSGMKLKTSSQSSEGDISSIIAMNSQQFLGSMAITFQEKCFLSIVNSMLGESYSSINDENRDAASEICNQIFGRAKNLLNQIGHTIQPALPTIVTGKSHQIRHSAHGPIISVEFSTGFGLFMIEAVTEKRS